MKGIKEDFKQSSFIFFIAKFTTCIMRNNILKEVLTMLNCLLGFLIGSMISVLIFFRLDEAWITKFESDKFVIRSEDLVKVQDIRTTREYAELEKYKASNLE